MISFARLPLRKLLLDLRSLHPAAGVAVVGAPLPLLSSQRPPGGGGSPKVTPTSRYFATDEAPDAKTGNEPKEDLVDVLQKRRTAGEAKEPKKKPAKEPGVKVPPNVVDRSVKDQTVNKTPTVIEPRLSMKELNIEILDDLFDLEPEEKSSKEDIRTRGKPWMEGNYARVDRGNEENLNEILPSE